MLPLPSLVRARPLGPPSLPPPRRPGAPAARGAPSRPARLRAGGRWRPASRPRGERRLPANSGGRGTGRDVRPRPRVGPARPLASPARGGAAAGRRRPARGRVPATPGNPLLPGRRRGCSAGKLTCARAPPPRRPAARSARRRRWGWGRQRPAPPLGRICLPPKARVLALTLPCFGGLSQAPRNISYREPLREGPRRRRLPGPSPASASCRTSGDLCTPLLPNPRARDLFPGRLPLGREGVRSSGRGRTYALL